MEMTLETIEQDTAELDAVEKIQGEKNSEQETVAPPAIVIEEARTLLASRVFVALDVPNRIEAMRLVDQLAPYGVSFKIGMQLFYAEGIALVRDIQKRLSDGSEATVFVDLKLHDIPNTVAKATEALVQQGVRFLNVHALGGQAMMASAALAAETTALRMGLPKPTLLGVTVLTSHDAATLKHDLRIDIPLDSTVTHLAKLANQSGLDGVVCSAKEAMQIQAACGKAFLKVTPGIRLPENGLGDQVRVLTPEEALRAGATHLVIGRPVITSPSPEVALECVLNSMMNAFS